MNYLIGLCLLWIVGSRGQPIVQENVVFIPVNKFSVTQATWTVSFILDLKIYDDFVETLDSDIRVTEDTLRRIKNKYRSTNSNDFLNLYMNSITGLDSEFQSVYGTYSALIHKVSANKFIRAKRGWLNAGSEILRTVFGVARDSDIQDVKSVLATLHQRQIRLMHVSAKYLSILNVTQSATKENRDQLNDVVKTLGQFDVRLKNFSESVNTQLIESNNFMITYFHLDLLVSEIRDLVMRANLLFEHLDSQLTAVSLGHLSPNLISPFNLRTILLEIKAELPALCQLPFSLDNDLINYYKYLPLSGVVEGNKLIMLIKIPLVQQYESFTMYDIINIPIIHSNRSQDHSLTKSAVVKYDLPHRGIAINEKHDRYALLTSEDFQVCATAPYCTLEKPLYSTGNSNDCIAKLFLGREQDIKRQCNKVINMHMSLPYAAHLIKGSWLVVTDEPLRLAIQCKGINQITSTWIDVHIPFDIVQVQAGCVASSDKLTLSATYDYKSNVTISDELIDAVRRSVNISSVALWHDYNKRIISLTDVTLPKTLPTLDYIPMDTLINEVEQARELQVKQHYNYVALVAAAVILVLIIAALAVYTFCKCRTTRARGYKGIKSIFKIGKQIEKQDHNGKLLVGSIASAPDLGNIADMAVPTKLPTDVNSDQRAYIALYPDVKK